MTGPLETLSTQSRGLDNAHHALAALRETVTVTREGSAFTMEQEINFLARFIYERFRNRVNAASEPALAEDYFNKLLDRVEETGLALYRLYHIAGGDDAQWQYMPTQEEERENRKNIQWRAAQAVLEDTQGYDEALHDAEQTVQLLFWEMFPIYERLHGDRGESSSHQMTSAFIKLYGAWNGCRKALESFPHHHYHDAAFVAFVDALEMAPPIIDDIGLWPEDDLPVDSLRLSALIEALKHWGERDWFDEGPQAAPGGASRSSSG
ncbi:MAG: hypothetical protein J0L97_05145 [Alphaproteobacteria bacterium]|nr:hypothetical protein [Alphaproteobacteria bacterium]